MARHARAGYQAPPAGARDRVRVRHERRFRDPWRMPTMTTAAEVLKTIRDNDVRYVDFRFTDPRGKWQHVTFDVSLIDEEIFDEGTMFDGSSTST